MADVDAVTVRAGTRSAGAGRGVQIFPREVELSTQHAADMLNVSRPYLIGLLEGGKIPFRKVGRHRRVRFEDLMDYKRRDDLGRRAAADELAELSEDLDLYDHGLKHRRDTSAVMMPGSTSRPGSIVAP